MSATTPQRRYIPARTPLSARRLNESQEALTRSARDARQVDLSFARQPRLLPRYLRITAVQADYLEGVWTDTTPEGDEEDTIFVAKPYELRRSSYHGRIKDGYTYTYDEKGTVRTISGGPLGPITEDLAEPWRPRMPGEPGTVVLCHYVGRSGVKVEDAELDWVSETDRRWVGRCATA